MSTQTATPTAATPLPAASYIVQWVSERCPDLASLSEEDGLRLVQAALEALFTPIKVA